MKIKKFNEILREKRIEKRLTLKEFCELAGDDPANLSRVELGLRTPPKAGIIERYAIALGLEDDEYQAFMDLAALARREIPDNISDEDLYGKFPAFICNMDRSTRPTDKQYKEAIKIVKKAFKR